MPVRDGEVNNLAPSCLDQGLGSMGWEAGTEGMEADI